MCRTIQGQIIVSNFITRTQRGQSPSTGLSAEAEQALIDKIANSVVDKLIKGDPTTEHEGDEHFNIDLVHDNDNEEEMDVEFIRAAPSY
jgi:hypothetical protein